MDSALRTETYPIQTQDYTAAAAPPVSEKSSKKPVLPKSIRALKDSNHARGHERTIVICLDGTGDQFDNDNSNVVHFVSCLKKHLPEQQMTYYQSGIGTYDVGGLKNGIGAAMDMAVGSGLGIHIKDAYRFLMQNYREGDKICLLGFSRGAYTVRCLAGMLHKVGLLPGSNGAQVNFAYDFYKDNSEEGFKMSAEFKKTFCTDINVWFLGLWDCVASVGFIPRKLPFSKSATNTVKYFRHAMALDEHRAKFKVCQWQHQNPDLKRAATIDETPFAQFQKGLNKTGLFNLPGSKKAKEQKAKVQIANHKNQDESNGSTHSNISKESDKTEDPDPDGSTSSGPDPPRTNSKIGRIGKTNTDQSQMESEFDALDARRRKHKACEADALEVWFMGAHADVGGGAVANENRHMLSRIPLRWMLRQCFECDTGILFDTACLADLGLDVHTLWPKYASPTPPVLGPAPSLQDKYERKALPKLQRRSALLNIGRADDGEDDSDSDNDNDGEKEELGQIRARHQDAILPETTEDHFDALARCNDQLKDAKGWWILEVWPVKVRVRNHAGDGWEKRVRLNMGRYRAVRESEPKMHWTVQRMIDDGKYKLRGRCLNGTVWKCVA